jgi:hypothetical protein
MSKRMSNYKQLIQAQRYQIEILKKTGKNQKEMGEFKQTTLKSHSISYKATTGVTLANFPTSQF